MVGPLSCCVWIVQGMGVDNCEQCGALRIYSGRLVIAAEGMEAGIVKQCEGDLHFLTVSDRARLGRGCELKQRLGEPRLDVLQRNAMPPGQLVEKGSRLGTVIARGRTRRP
ncbi:hypothetical protein D9M72_323730 [compost metagenome]